MPLTKEMGYDIRESHSNEKEKNVCDEYNLTQIGGNRTKIDGIDNENGNHVSIKNSSSRSTQVHLTTQKKFIEKFSRNEKEREILKNYLEPFCGNGSINNNGKDRYNNDEISNEYKQPFVNLLNDNKENFIDIFISNDSNIKIVIWRDTKNGIDYKLTYVEIMEKIKNCTWVFKKGAIHLKNENGKTYFHIQREGKKNPNNRINVLVHIHKNIFI